MLSVENIIELKNTYPDDGYSVPKDENGEPDYNLIENLPRTTREEKIKFCCICNKVFGVYLFVTYSKLSDEALNNQVELFEYFLS